MGMQQFAGQHGRTHTRTQRTSRASGAFHSTCKKGLGYGLHTANLDGKSGSGSQSDRALPCRVWPFGRPPTVINFPPKADVATVDEEDSVGDVTLSDLPMFAEETTLPPFVELDKGQSVILLNIVSFLYGTNTTGVKTVLDQSHMAPSIISCLRFDVAALIMLPLLFRPGINKINWPLTFELGLYLALGYGLQTMELVTSSASEGSAILAIYLVLVPIIEMFNGRSLTIKKVAALSVAVAGVALLASGGGDPADPSVIVEAVPTILGIPAGSFYGLTGSVIFALHLVRSEIRQCEAADIGQLAAGQLVVCALLSNLWAIGDVGLNTELLPQVDPSYIATTLPWVAFLATSIFCTAGCQTGELVAVGKIPSSTASLTLSLLVVWGLFTGALVNHDTLSPTSWAGAALIIGAGIVPKVLDVLNDRSAANEANEALGESADGVDAPPAELAPVDVSTPELVTAFASGGMLASTPLLMELGLLGEGGLVAASVTGVSATEAVQAGAAIGSAGAAITGATTAAGVVAPAVPALVGTAAGTAGAAGAGVAAASGAVAGAAGAGAAATTGGALAAGAAGVAAAPVAGAVAGGAVAAGGAAGAVAAGAAAVAGPAVPAVVGATAAAGAAAGAAAVGGAAAAGATAGAVAVGAPIAAAAGATVGAAPIIAGSAAATAAGIAVSAVPTVSTTVTTTVTAVASAVGADATAVGASTALAASDAAVAIGSVATEAAASAAASAADAAAAAAPIIEAAGTALADAGQALLNAASTLIR